MVKTELRKLWASYFIFSSSKKYISDHITRTTRMILSEKKKWFKELWYFTVHGGIWNIFINLWQQNMRFDSNMYNAYICVHGKLNYGVRRKFEIKISKKYCAACSLS